jgi:endonuclease-3
MQLGRTAASASIIADRLARAIPRPRIELDFADEWQLLIATILSARVSDTTVNRVTPELFARYPTPEALAAAEPADVERIVRRTGFFHNKTQAIRDASRVLVERFDGRVPRTIERLCELPGVARKTANVVLAGAFGIASGIVVDTHVARVAHRLGLTRAAKPDDVERDLCLVFPRRTWTPVGLRLVLHGRYVCTARAPRCADCPLNEVCPSAEASPSDTWTARADRERALVTG